MTPCSTGRLGGVLSFDFLPIVALLEPATASCASPLPPLRSGDVDMVRAAIKNGANPNQSESDDVPVRPVSVLGVL